VKSLDNLTLYDHSVKYPPTPSRGKFHNIRVHARKTMKAAKVPKQCKVCGYKNYVEVCHIKGIADFNNSSLIQDINALSNLVYLCPNHHWVLDNNILKYEK